MRKEDQTRLLAEIRRRVADRERNDATSAQLAQLVQGSVDAERERLTKEPLSVRTLVDRAFWLGIQMRTSLGGEAAADDALWAVISHYAEEICGDFDPIAYEIALRILPPALRVLLSPSSVTEIPARASGDKAERIVLHGETQTVRALHAACSLVFAPTHHSNLDSIVLGLALHQLDIPPVIYGAGINLLSNPIMGLFMHNFGAYTVDRQKTDRIYRDTLKEYVVVTLEEGYHHLFYPGGTRSRSGALETKLKLGLLGASAEAQKNLLDRGASRRVLVVPVTLSYELVPEAESLASSSEERRARLAEFAQRLLSMDSRIHVVFGAPLTVAGAAYDEAAPSETWRVLHDQLTSDPRDATQQLGEAIGGQYLRDNLVLPTHAAAFALRAALTDGESAAARDAVERSLDALLARLHGLAERGHLRLPESLSHADARAVLLQADTVFASYHRRRALVVEAATVHSEDPQLLAFYANRLTGYHLETT